MGVVVNMKNVGTVIDEGDYIVTLTRVSAKTNAKGNDVITLGTTISRENNSEFDGRQLPVFFTINNDPDADNYMTLERMQNAFVAFGADEDEVVSESFDPEKIGKPLYGTKALAHVAHQPNTNDPSKAPYLRVNLEAYDM